jgi:hypothetical protein
MENRIEGGGGGWWQRRMLEGKTHRGERRKEEGVRRKDGGRDRSQRPGMAGEVGRATSPPRVTFVLVAFAKSPFFASAASPNINEVSGSRIKLGS